MSIIDAVFAAIARRGNWRVNCVRMTLEQYEQYRAELVELNPRGVYRVTHIWGYPIEVRP